jgi:polyvinyl alcohol dehydrogenase (cytochrome)
MLAAVLAATALIGPGAVPKAAQAAERTGAAAPAAQADGTAPWTSFGFDAAHSSENTKAVSVSSSNAGTLTQAWQFVTPAPTKSGQPTAFFDGSPVVADGLVFIGSNTGLFYALNEATGSVAWSLNAGYLPKHTCPAAGIRDTATVAVDPATGNETVYFAGANGKLWAVNALTGALVWSADVFPTTKASAPYVWGSPLVHGGRVYIGIASGCDDPLTRGGLVSFNQSTGKHLRTFWAVSAGVVGGSIWSTPAEDANGVFVTTGNGNEEEPDDQGLSNSIVLLNPTTLKAESHWTVPNIATVDDDFGSSPTLFTATIDGTPTAMVGACNKNGVYYAWKQSDLAAGPVWAYQAGNAVAPPNNACLATAAWNGSDLFIIANTSTVSGTSYPAVARELDPATGTPVWQTGLADGPVLGSTALDGDGVLASVTFSQSSPPVNQLALVDAVSGALLATYPLSIKVGGGPTYADGYIFFGGSDGILHAYQPSASSSPRTDGAPREPLQVP